ncbi:MAG: PHP domain-containing protein [Anaerolineales bacterium]
MLTIEFHCHTHASPDSQVRPADLVATCRLRGLDRVVVTDHWNLAGALEAQALDPELVIVGEEVLTDRGELLAAFVSELIPRGMPYREAIAALRQQGAFISVSHPFDPRRSFWSPAELEELTGLVDAFETFNARNLLPGYNRKAAEFAAAHGLPGTAGSDAHTLEELGLATMRLPDFSDGDGLRAAIGQAEFRTRRSAPWVRLASRWARFTKNRRT